MLACVCAHVSRVILFFAHVPCTIRYTSVCEYASFADLVQTTLPVHTLEHRCDANGKGICRSDAILRHLADLAYDEAYYAHARAPAPAWMHTCTHAHNACAFLPALTHALLSRGVISCMCLFSCTLVHNVHTCIYAHAHIHSRLPEH